MSLEKVSSNINSRIFFFDIAKGIGIISVILGHGGIVPEIVKKIIFSYHMPLFFLISGYFFYIRDTRELLKRNARHLLIPYLFTCIFIIIISAVKSIIELDYYGAINQIKIWLWASLYGSGVNYSSPFYIKQIGAIWFLLSLFIALYCVNNALKDKYSIVWILLLSYIGYKTSTYLWLPFSIQAGLMASIFVYIGYLVKKFQILEKNIPKPFICGMFGLWIFCIIFGKLSMASNLYKNGILDIAGAICGVYFIIQLSIIIESHSKYLSILFRTLGNYSLVVLCFHLIELNTFPWKSINQVLIDNGCLTPKLVILFFKLLWISLAIVSVNKIGFLQKVFSIKQHPVTKSE